MVHFVDQKAQASTLSGNEAGTIAAGQATDEIIAAAEQLRDIVGRITPEEFRWQEANYDRDSLLGRELLFLAANNEWVRATAEIIDIARSDAVETLIKIDIDLDQITHEAFQQDGGRLWLPVVVLPPLVRPRLPEPDPFATLTVTDAAGNLLATLPNADVRHRLSAAMAEIIVNMAVAWWPGKNNAPDTIRDQRLLLSAAIYRLLLRERATPPSGEGAAKMADGPLPRIDHARRELLKLIELYLMLLSMTNIDPADKARAAAAPAQPDETPVKPGGSTSMPFVRRLTERAVRILSALTESTIVVVMADRDNSPTVLTVRVPSRILRPVPPERSLRHPRSWRWLRPNSWNWVLPCAHVQVDLLLPSADADRQVEVNLPDGVSFDPSRPRARQAEMEIRVKQPSPLEHVKQLMRQLQASSEQWSATLYQCVADLAGVKAEAAEESLRDHRVRPGTDAANPTASELRTATQAVRDKLVKLRVALGRLSEHGDYPAVQADLEKSWDNGGWLESAVLQRRTSVDTISPRVVVARAGMIEDVSKRATPDIAKIHVHIAVTDAEYFSIARFSGWMSTLLMAVVGLFLLSAQFLKVGDDQVSPEVLAIVLTLFSAIQAGRIERSDQSTVRGMLALAGNKLIVASILPAVLLAVALAFRHSGIWTLAWAGGCIGGQLLLQGLLRLRLRRAQEPDRHPAGRSALDSRLVFITDPPNYSHSETLSSSWWRSTTADALMLGRQAYGYVIWQRDTSPTLRELLDAARPPGSPIAGPEPLRGRLLRRFAGLAAEFSSSLTTEDLVGAATGDHVNPDSMTSPDGHMPPERPANVLALQRSGTPGQAMTFAVFREQPKADWVKQPVVFPVDLNPDQLAPTESVTGIIEIFLGLPKDQDVPAIKRHPVTAMLTLAKKHRLSVHEIQLPVPAPANVYSDHHWARLQIAVREFELDRIVPFLRSIWHRTCPARPAAGPDGMPACKWITGIRMTAESSLRILNPQAPTAIADTDLVLASDMDVTTSGRSLPSKTEDATWRVLAVCADQRNGIENYILRKLGKKLRLTGLTYVILHGKAVMLLVGHHPGKPPRRSNLRSALNKNPKGDRIEVCVDDWQSGRALGKAKPEPLLRVHIRTPDRRGATLDALDALREILQATASGSGSIQAADWNVWYARIEITGGRAQILLTLRLSVDPARVERWKPAKFEDMERQVRQLAAHKAASAAGTHSDDPGPQEDTIITIRRLTMPSLPQEQDTQPRLRCNPQVERSCRCTDPGRN